MTQRILQLCPALDSGGIERGTVEVAIATQKAGYECIVMSNGGQMVKSLEAHGIEHITHPINKKSLFSIYSSAIQLSNFLKERDIHLIHARSRAPIWVAAMATRKTKVPLVTACHSPHGPGPFGIKKLYNAGITYGDKVIAVSKYIQNYLEKDYKIPTDKISLVYCGVDTDYFNPANITNVKIKEIKDHYHIPEQKKILLLPGRITRWKGQHVLLEALTQLKSLSDFYAVIVGRIDSKDYHQELKQFITKHQLSDHVLLLENHAEMPELYAIADMVFSTSIKPEAFGRVAVEGQAMEKIVIASRLGAATETVIDGETGFLVPANDATALANTIEKACNMDCTQLKIQAREHVSNHFSAKKMCNDILAIYKTLL